MKSLFILITILSSYSICLGQSQGFINIQIESSVYSSEKTKDILRNSYKNYLWKLSRQKGLDPELTARQIKQESGWNPKARGTSGEKGLGQFMPRTGKRLGLKNPYDPYESMEVYTNYMAFLVGKYGTYELALVAYNAGEGTADRAVRHDNWRMRIPKSTRHYVSCILDNKEPRRKRASVRQRQKK